MIPPKWIDHDTLEVPAPAYEDNDQTKGDGIQQIGPGHENFEQWSRYVTEQLGLKRPTAS